MFEIELFVYANGVRTAVFYGQVESFKEAIDTVTEWQSNIAGPMIKNEIVITSITGEE